MPRIENQSSLNPEANHLPVIDRLCAVIKLPYWSSRTGTPKLFVGWTNSLPIVVTSERQLSAQAKESFDFSDGLSCPWGKELSPETMHPVEFMSVGRPIDRSNPSEQDCLVYSVKSDSGETEFIKVLELDILQAVKEYHLVWEDLNSNTMLAQETIPALRMHTLLLIAQQNDKKSIFTLLFSPVMKDESNEVMYQNFLVRTVESLLSLDRQSAEGQKRGYERVVTAYLNRNVMGSDAYVVMKKLVDLGLFSMSDEQLDHMRIQSAGKGFGEQLQLLAHQAGLWNMPEISTKVGQKLENLSIEELTKILAAFYRLAKEQIE